MGQSTKLYLGIICVHQNIASSGMKAFLISRPSSVRTGILKIGFGAADPAGGGNGLVEADWITSPDV